MTMITRPHPEKGESPLFMPRLFMCAPARRSRGAAMLLVLIAVAIATILALSFLAGQGPTQVVAENIDRKARARQIAESALKMAIDYVNENESWRSDKTSGQWIAEAPLYDGTFDLYGTDDEDGDLADDASQPVLLSVVATYRGVTHRVSARVTPGDESLPQPAHHWKLDETAGKTIVDSAGSVNGVNHNAQLARTGVHDNAAEFDGSSQHIEVPHDDALLLDHGTFAFWFQAGDTSGHQAIISKDSSGYDHGGHIHIYLDGQTLTAWLQDTSTTYTLTSSASISPGQWYHGAVVFGDLGMSLYLNGSEVDSDSYTGGLGATSGGPGNKEPMVFGYGTWGSGDTVKTPLSYPYRGLLDDIRIYDIGLTAEEVSLLYNEDVDDKATPRLLALYEFEQVEVAPTLVARWQLDEIAVPGAGTVQSESTLTLSNTSMIDAYNSSSGAYGGANSQLDVSFLTNTNGNNDVELNGDATIYGDVLVGSGATPSSVIELNGVSAITGTQTTQPSNATIPTYDAPSGFAGHSGNQTYSGGSHTWSSNQHFNKLAIENDATIYVSGDVEVRVSNMTDIEDGDIILNPGANLTLWAGHNVTIGNGSTINNDTTRPGDFTLIQYGNNRNIDLEDGVIVGAVHAANNLTINNGSAIYGNVIAEDSITINDGAIHADFATGAPGAAVSYPSHAEDSSTLGNNGTIHSQPTVGVDGQHGTAFDFDGSDDYVEIPHDDSYLMQAGTFSVWFKTDAITSGKQGLFSKDSTGYGTGGHFSVFVEGSEVRVRMQSTTESYWVESGDGSVAADHWYHIMFAWGEEGMALYLNGTLVDTNDYTGGLGKTSGGVGNHEPIVLGANAWLSDDLAATPLHDYFAGTLDDLRIFNERLNESQAVEIYNGADEPSPFLSKAIVRDTSGFGDPLDLAVQDTDAVTWSDGSLTFGGDTLAVSLAAATKLHDAIEANGAFAIELIIERAAPGTTASPSHIVGYTDGPFSHNFLIGQDGADYEARVRDSDTGHGGGFSPPFVSDNELAAFADTHIVLSYTDSTATVYINGELDQAVTSYDGELDNWAADHLLVLAGAYTGASHWRGTIKRLAVYDRSFNRTQADNVYNGEPPGSGQSGAGAGRVDWDEED